jgi:hypothetical protein
VAVPCTFAASQQVSLRHTLVMVQDRVKAVTHVVIVDPASGEALAAVAATLHFLSTDTAQSSRVALLPLVHPSEDMSALVQLLHALASLPSAGSTSLVWLEKLAQSEEVWQRLLAATPSDSTHVLRDLALATAEASSSHEHLMQAMQRLDSGDGAAQLQVRSQPGGQSLP